MENIIRNLPVASFYYRGSHSHPVRRTVLLTEAGRDFYKGYEVRNGNETFDVTDAPIKTFLKDKIATVRQLRGKSNCKSNDSTLERMSLSVAADVGW